MIRRDKPGRGFGNHGLGDLIDDPANPVARIAAQLLFSFARRITQPIVDTAGQQIRDLKQIVPVDRFC